MISYIVSYYNRVASLNACVASLNAQEGPKEILVCNNGPVLPWIPLGPSGKLLQTGAAGAQSCYDSAALAAKDASGDWLCFPSDDSLYVGRFQRIMLEIAASESADLVYCDCVYALGTEKNRWPPYSVLETQPKMGRIDKTCFIMRRSLFTEFPPHEWGYRDGALIEQLVKGGVKMAKAPGVLVVHQ